MYRFSTWYPGGRHSIMHDEQFYPPQLDFNLNNYQRDESGLVAEIGDARAIIRNLHQIIQFLQASAFEHLPLPTQSEIALYLVGTYLLTHDSNQQDPEYQDKIVLLETLFNADFDTMIKQTRRTLDPADILQTVERLFENFGKSQEP